MSDINKNLSLVKQYLQETIENGNEELSKHFQGSILGSVVLEPLFRLLIGPEQTKSTIQMLHEILEVSKNFTGNFEGLDDQVNKIMNLDPTHQILRKDIKPYEQAVKFLKDSYMNRIKFYHKLLQGTGDTWEELYRTAFKSKEYLLEDIQPELEALDGVKEVVRKNRRLVNVPGLIRADIIDAMFFIQDFAKEALLKIPYQAF